MAACETNLRACTSPSRIFGSDGTCHVLIMVVFVGLQQVPPRRRHLRWNRPRIVSARATAVHAFKSDLSQEPAETEVVMPVHVTRIDSPRVVAQVSGLAKETESVESVNEAAAPMKLLDRVTSGKDAFWVIPNRLLISTAVIRDSLPSELIHTKISVIVRLLSNSGGLPPMTTHKPIRYRTAARVANFTLDVRHKSLATILSDLVHQIVNILKNEVVLLQCPNDDGWDLAVSALLLAGSAGVSIQEAISRLRVLCIAIEKRWTMDAHLESVLLRQLQQIPRVMLTASETSTDLGQISLGLPRKALPTRRLARPMLVPLRPHSTRVIVAEPFQPVESRRLVAARDQVQVQNE